MIEGIPPTNEELLALIQRGKEIYEKMTPEERAAMHKRQAESWARAEMNWPKPKFKYIDGVKVYESYEDYCND